MKDRQKVLIVGAGPTGLTLAIELAKRNIPFRIIDQTIKPVATSNALAVQIRTLELFEDIGIIDAALAEGTKLKKFNLIDKQGTIAQVELSRIKTKFPFILGLSQQQTETIMLNHLASQGIQVEMSKHLIDIKLNNNQAEVTIVNPDEPIEITTFDWVMACDGGKSIIREKLKIPFLGHDLKEHFVMADALLESRLSPEEVYAFLSRDGVFAIIHHGHHYARIIADVTHDPKLKESKSPTADDFIELTQKRCPFSIQYKNIIWKTGFWIHRRLIEKYSYHNVFFLGDAAHLHSPIGGQGMNIGIQDAYNLAWKLALVLSGKANPTLLTTYETERRPIAENVLKFTTFFTHFMTIRNPILCRLRNFILRKIATSKKLSTQLINAIAETRLIYDKSLIVEDHISGPRPKAGERFIDVNFNGQSLFDYVKGIKFTVIIFIPRILTNHEYSQFSKLHLYLNNFPSLLNTVTIHRIPLTNNGYSTHNIFDKDSIIHESYGIKNPVFYLVRPDKYIGFRGKASSIKQFINYFDKIYTAQ